MKLWVDDARVPPDHSWWWAQNYTQAIGILVHWAQTPGHELEAPAGWEQWYHTMVEIDLLDGLVLSLDHDPGEGETGYKIVCFMEEHSIWPETIYLHSANPVGVQNMARALERGPYRRLGNTFTKV